MSNGNANENSEWLTTREAAQMLGVWESNLKTMRGFDRIECRPRSGPYGSNLYKRSDVVAVQQWRASGAAKAESRARRAKTMAKKVVKRAGPKKKVVKRAKPGKHQQIVVRKSGRKVSDSTYEANRRKIQELEQAVIAGKVKPLSLPSDVREL